MNTSSDPITKNRSLLARTLPLALAINFVGTLIAFGLVSLFRDAIEWFTLEQIRNMCILSLIYSNCIQAGTAFTLSYSFSRLISRPSWGNWLWFVTKVLLAALLGFVVAALVVSTLEGIVHADVDDSPVTKIITSIWSLVFINVVYVAAFYYESVRTTLEATTLQLRTKELEEERAKKFAIEARLSSLEARMHPHFLFNTLNSISALIPDDPVRAERMVGRLAALLRFSLDSHRRRVVPLRQELRVVCDYLEIEKARFTDRLRYSIHVDSELEAIEVLPLALQTLVENSVKYAVAPRREGGEIRLVACAVEDQLRLEVWDDGPGFTPDAIIAGHGLDNLQARLEGIFGAQATLDVARRDGYMVVAISLPQHLPQNQAESLAA